MSCPPACALEGDGRSRVGQLQGLGACPPFPKGFWRGPKIPDSPGALPRVTTALPVTLPAEKQQQQHLRAGPLLAGRGIHPHPCGKHIQALNGAECGPLGSVGSGHLHWDVVEGHVLPFSPAELWRHPGRVEQQWGGLWVVGSSAQLWAPGFSFSAAALVERLRTEQRLLHWPTLLISWAG